MHFFRSWHRGEFTISSRFCETGSPSIFVFYCVCEGPRVCLLCFNSDGVSQALEGSSQGTILCTVECLAVSPSSAHGIPKATPPHKLWQPQTPVRAKYVTEQSYCAKALPFKAALVPPAYEY